MDDDQTQPQPPAGPANLAQQAVAVRGGDNLGPDALLELAADEQAARIQWVQEKIAHNALAPLLPPRPWAGRSDIVELTRHQWSVDHAEAGALVDLAVTHLWDLEKGDNGPVKLELMLLRFKDIRKLVRKAITDGRVETTYKYRPHPTLENTLQEVKEKEKRYAGVDMSGVQKLIEIELAIAQLENLNMKKAGGGMDAIAKIFEQMDARHRAAEDAKNGKASDRGVIGSRAQQLLAGPVDGSSPEGMKVVRAAFLEMQQPVGTNERGGARKATKRVQSKSGGKG